MKLRSVSNLLVMSLTVASLVVLTGCPFLFPPVDGDPNDPNVPMDPNEPNEPNEPNTPTTEKTLHEKIFTEIITDGFADTSDCMICHSDIARDLMAHGHWTWEGLTDNIVGLEGEVVGKMNLLNNFCIAIPSNEGRCSQCHPSFGWKSTSPASFFDEPDNVDCLICHDTTGTYRKHPSANGGGGPASVVVDGTVTVATAEQLQPIAYNVGTPSRNNCGLCHYFAGGGDNVKHGDLAAALNDTTREFDVHMGTDGLDFACQQCHTVQDHGIAGMPIHSVDDGGAKPDCTRCHGERPHEDDPTLASVYNFHTARIACETCHIPTFARNTPTKVEWYWDEAGQDIDPIPTDALGQATYNKMKGRFVWAKSVAPTLMWYNGKWDRMVIGLNDTYDEAGTAADPIVIATPVATMEDTDAKIYPFKKMIGRQPIDPVNQRMIVPHLFGSSPGLENPYWASYEWGPALAEGAAFAGQDYSGTFDFANTVMYLKVSHEVAPRSEALTCGDCHGNDAFFQSLGYDGDPFPN